jgi:energy-coupling factor transporter ATP-binding protein EcfA2
MTKLVKLKIDEGNFEVGFKVTVQIGEDGKLYDTEFEGRLPSYPTIPNDYQGWRTNYLTLDKSWCGPVSGKVGNKKGETIQLVQLAKESAKSFHVNFTKWLNSTNDKAFQSFKSKLYEKLENKSTEIRVIIQTDNPLLKKLPWHEWDLFAKTYSNAEVAIGATAFDKPISPVTSNKLRILAILGNSEGIDIEKDRETLKSLEESPQVHIEFLDEPNRDEISDELWKDNWNILFFAGHSSSEDEKGYLYINNRTDDNKLTIEELKDGLREAIKRGLQLAIFNSCDGLKLAEDLADLNIPQVLFMREPVIDEVAQAFLKCFLEQFSQGESLYLAVRHARKQLSEKDFDNKFPGSSWLPVIFQNPTVIPPTWRELKGFLKPPNPYRALSPFREEDSEYFFGRKKVIERMQNIVEKQNFVMVLGASGSGKSSVVFSGLVPYLRQQKQKKQWSIAQFRPQSNPFYQLALALVPLLHPDKQSQTKEFTPFAKALYEGKINLSQTMQDIAKSHVNQQILLIVDQFEELYTSSIDVQHRFIDQLLQIVETTSQQNAWENLPQFTLLIMLRADFLGKVLTYAPFAEMSNKYSDIKLGYMGEDGLKAAIEKPAEKQSVKIEVGLTDRILQDLGQAPGNLSLLEFALDQLWKSMSGGIITHEDYDAIGGVKQAIAQYANDFYDTLNPKEQATLRRIMVQLVRPGEGTDDARQVAIRSQIGEENWHLVIRLADARLVVTGQDKDTKQETVELIHEALIHHWQLLKDWMNENRDALRTKRNIETAAKEWEAHDKHSDYLLKKPKLNIAEDYYNESC